MSRVEATDLEDVSQALKDRFGYDTGAYEDYIHNRDNQKGIIKLDYNLNQNHTITAKYNFLDAILDKPAHPSAIGRRGPDFTTLQFENSGYQIQNKIHSGIVEWKALFGNAIANKFQVGYTAFIDSRDPFSEPFPVINIAKNGSRYIVAGHEPFSIHNRLDQNLFQISNNLNIYRGAHTITVGAALEKFDFDNSFNLNAYGGTFDPDFVSPQAFLDSLDAGVLDPIVEGAENTFANNGGDSGTLGEGWALAETNVGQAAVYIQDEWNANKDLTLTLGLRVDIPLYFDTDEKIQENIDRNNFFDDQGNLLCCVFDFIEYFDDDGNLDPLDHNPFGNNAYVFTNTDKGYSFNATLQIQRDWGNDFFTSLGYNYGISKDVSSIEAEISSDAYDRNPTLGNVNEDVLSNSIYGNRHRVVGTAYKRFVYSGKKMATTVALFFEYTEGNRYSYTYSGDINLDASPLNDLIYIPTDGEIDQMTFSGDMSDPDPANHITPQQMADALKAYIAQDEYLDGRRGDYAEKYSSLAPWFSTWDLRIMQDFNFNVGERVNTFQLTFDILNVGNLINPDWGLRQFPTTTQPIGVAFNGIDEPVYSFDPSLKSTFTDDFGLLSRWQLQIGGRYIF